MTNININELRTLLSLISAKLEKDNLTDIEFTFDEYWIILADEWNKFNSPPNLSVGSIQEDVDYLKRSIEEGVIFSYSDFDRVASVLRAISEMQAQTNE